MFPDLNMNIAICYSLIQSYNDTELQALLNLHSLQRAVCTNHVTLSFVDFNQKNKLIWMCSEGRSSLLRLDSLSVLIWGWGNQSCLRHRRALFSSEAVKKTTEKTRESVHIQIGERKKKQKVRYTIFSGSKNQVQATNESDIL